MQENWSNFTRFQQFLNCPLLALDYGTKVAGTAIFCPGRDPYPLPFENIVYKSDSQLILEIKKLCKEECIEGLIIGIPYLTDGQSTPMTQKVRTFLHQCKKEVGPLPVFEQDETLSTFEAQDRMKNSPQYDFKVNLDRLDCVSASIILEDFLKSGERP